MNEIEQNNFGAHPGRGGHPQISITRETGLLETGAARTRSTWLASIQFLEERFGIRIPDSDIGADLFTSPASLISYVEQRLGTTPNWAVPGRGLDRLHQLAAQDLARGAAGKLVAEFDKARTFCEASRSRQ